MAPPAPLVAGSATSLHLPAYLHTGISFTRCGFGQRDRRRHETEPLRSLSYSRSFYGSFYENSVRRVYYVKVTGMRRFYFAGDESWNTSHTVTNRPSNARARGACKLYVATLAAGTDTRLTSPSYCPLALRPPHPNSDRGTSERTRRTTRVRLSTQSVQYCHLLFTNATWIARACACLGACGASADWALRHSAAWVGPHRRHTPG